MTRAFIFTVSIVLISRLAAQEHDPNFSVMISDIVYQKVNKNWLFIPKSVDLRIYWTTSAGDELAARGGATVTGPRRFRVVISDGRSHARLKQLEVEDVQQVALAGLAMGSHLSFAVQALDDDNEVVAESEVATIVVGQKGGGLAGLLPGRTWYYYLHPGRWQLAMVGKAEIYDHSTSLGKVAFIFLSVTAMASFLILVFYSSRTLYLGNVFPFKRSVKGLMWSFTLSCDASYNKRLTEKFKFVLDAWEMIATKSKVVADKAVKTIPTGLSSTEKMASVDVACMEYWTSDGDRAIGTIEDIIAYPEYRPNGRVKTPDDVLTELVIKIEDNFHDLVMENTNGNGGYHARQQHDMQNLIDEIYEPVVVDDRPLSRFRKLLLRKGVFDLRKGLRPFPTSRIIHAGLEIHRMNGHRWSKPTEEVKRAFEDRASNEIEILKRKSKIEWFWNYGALAPLVGLFGTVTGITFAFQQLGSVTMTTDFSRTIHLLSNGIFEALWTTIFGLANGILFVIIYYYFRHKLDWIYSKWEEIYVSITEKL